MSCSCDLAYVAGFFDGEGYVGITRSKGTNYGIRVELQNTYEPILRSLKESFGGGVSERTERRPGYKRHWSWYATGRTAYAFLVTVLPYLREKKEQARETIAFYDLYGGINLGVRRPQEQRVDQEARLLRVQALKHKKEVAA